MIFLIILGVGITGYKAYFNYQSTHNYYYARSDNMSTKQQQEAFWNGLDKETAKKAGASAYYKDGWRVDLAQSNEDSFGYLDNGDYILIALTPDVGFGTSKDINNFDATDHKLTESEQALALKAIQAFKDFQDRYYKIEQNDK